MAELVQYNLEQHIQFFNELKNHFDEQKIKEFVRKRRHFEYKIASQNREYNSFESYIKHEIKVLKELRDLNIVDGGTSLITEQKNLIERLIRQITIHFQYLPKAFFFAIQVLKEIRRKSSERHYWEELLKKHGHKNVEFYIAAGSYAVKERNEVVYKKNECHVERELKIVEKKLAAIKDTNSIKNISKLEKEKEILMLELKKIKHISFIDHMNWTRDVILDAFAEFPKNKKLLKEYLKFEIIFQDYFIHCQEELDEKLLAVKNGCMIELTLNRIIKDFDDVSYFKEIIEIMRKCARNFESDALEKIQEFVRNAPVNEEVVSSEPTESMEVDEIDEFESFTSKYPDLKKIRCKNPKSIGTELHNYLQKLKEKILNGELDKNEELPKIRSAIEWILNDDEWSSQCLDLWWDYYEIEKNCGDVFKSNAILEKARQKLRLELKNELNLRKLFSQ